MDDKEKLKDLYEAIIDYIVYLKTEKGLSPATLDSYRHDLLGVYHSLLEQGFSTLKDIDAEVWQQTLLKISNGAKPRTLARKISSLRGFFKYMEMSGKPIQVEEEFLSPKIGRPLPSVLSIEEVEALLNACQGSGINELRDKAILEMLYATGMRVSELTELQLHQLFMDEGYIRVIGKGNKERIVPFGDMASMALKQYIDLGRPRQLKKHATNLVFLNNRGEGITRQTVWRVIKKYARKANIDENNKSLSPHILRHSFATHLLAGGAHLRFIQETLGHADIATTEIYTHIMNDMLLTTFHDTHPRSDHS